MRFELSGSGSLLPGSSGWNDPGQVQTLPSPAKRTVNFATDIQPILKQSCVNCHGKGRAKGGFQIDSRETILKESDSGHAIVPGRSEESLIIELVAGIDPENVMPQKGRRLTSEQISLLRAWMDQGLPWDDSVTFAKPAPLNMAPGAPKVDLLDGENPVDALLKPYFASKGITPGPLAEDRVFARRVYLDIIGLLPPTDELKAFLENKGPDKRKELVQRLLVDRKNFAEHWLTFWNDLLRNDYRGTGFTRLASSTWRTPRKQSISATNFEITPRVCRTSIPRPQMNSPQTRCRG